MDKINTESELRQAILELENARAAEGKLLKEQLRLTYEGLQPINLIKNTFKEIAASDELKDNLLNKAAGIAAGYLSQKMFKGISHSPLRKLLSSVFSFGVTNAIAQNPQALNSMAKGIFKIVNDLKPKQSERIR